MENKTQKKQFQTWFFMLVSGIIWAWFLTLPKAVLHTWVIPSVAVIIWLGIFSIIFHLIIAEISLSLPWEKTLLWFTKKVFPKRLATIISLIMIAYFVFCFIAYIEIGGGFISLLMQTIWIHISYVWWWLIFIATITFLLIKKWNFDINKILTITLLICIIAIILRWFWGQTDITAISGDISNRHQLYGIALLAMNWMVAIPLLYNKTGRSAITMRSVILSAWMVVTLLCLFFSLSALTMSWVNTTDNAIYGIIQNKPAWAIIWGILWTIAMINCYYMVSKHIQEIWEQDLRIKNKQFLFIAVLLPFLSYLYFNPNLLQMLWTAGGFLWSILIIAVSSINLLLYKTNQKVKILSIINYDKSWSRILILLGAIWIIWGILAL